MGIFSRMSDIVNANILSMLDKAEDPEKMVRLMIQEMEDTLIEVKTSAAKIISEQKGLERQIDAARKEEDGWQGKAELAVAKGRDDLARGALGEKNRRSEIKAALEAQLQASVESLEVFRKDIQELEKKLMDARSRQKSIIMRQRTAQGQMEIQNKIQSAKTTKAFSRFEQYEKELDRMEGTVEAFRMGPEADSLSDEINQLQKDSEIEDALHAIKRKVKKKANPEQE